MRLDRNPVLAGLIAAALLLGGCGSARRMTGVYAQPMVESAAVAAAKKERRQFGDPKNFRVIEGVVTEILPEDNDGLKHQQFIIKVGDRTVRVAHNTELAPHVPVKVGDHVTIKCVYIASKTMDVAHWTHWNPQGGEGGYIELDGKRYERLEGQR